MKAGKEDWHSPGRCPPAASSSRPEGSSGLGGSSEVGVPGTDLLVMKGRRGAGSKKMCRGTVRKLPSHWLRLPGGAG